MSSYEYKVINAPSRGARGPGVKGADGRFAHSLESLMNRMASEGWEFQRAETLPSEERSGLTSTQTVYRSVLVFRRKAASDLGAFDPRMLDAPDAPPLMLPHPEIEEEDIAAPDNQGLSALLRRRASRIFGPGAAVRPVDDTPATETRVWSAVPDVADPGEDDDDMLVEDDMPVDFYGSDTLEFTDRRAQFEMDETYQRPRSAAE